MKRVTKELYMELFDVTVHPQINMQANQEGCLGLVCFENPAFDSTSFGDRSSMPVGPAFITFKSWEALKHESGTWKYLHDLPSQRQYPTYYWTKDDKDVF